MARSYLSVQEIEKMIDAYRQMRDPYRPDTAEYEAITFRLQELKIKLAESEPIRASVVS
ncbi:MAG TPA: hypothetical protein VIB07_05195 [Nitrososphaera sp.]|jgi:hypothetical protein